MAIHVSHNNHTTHGAGSTTAASQSSSDELRLRLMTLLAMYDLLPYSISHPPNADEPLDLATAIDAQSLQRCLQSMTQQGILTSDEARAFSAIYSADASNNHRVSTGNFWIVY
jgi:hypothetical protein